MLCRDDGEVICAHCTCVAGMSDVCSHVGALLYAIVSTNDTTNPVNIFDLFIKLIDLIFCYFIYRLHEPTFHANEKLQHQ